MRADQFIAEIRWERAGPFIDMTQQMQKAFGNSAGMGYYSRVYNHPTKSDVMIKIFLNDRGYAEWLRWSLQNQNNPYVPQVIPHDDGSIIKTYKNISKIINGQLSSRFAVVNLRKLKKATKHDIDQFINYLMSFLVDDGTKTNINKFRHRRYSNTDNRLEKFDVYAWKQVYLNSKSSDPHLSSVAAEFIRYLIKFGHLDLHDENLMIDLDTNHIVFIDVLSVG
jgi:hypothetical protein